MKNDARSLAPRIHTGGLHVMPRILTCTIGALLKPRRRCGPSADRKLTQDAVRLTTRTTAGIPARTILSVARTTYAEGHAITKTLLIRNTLQIPDIRTRLSSDSMIGRGGKQLPSSTRSCSPRLSNRQADQIMETYYRTAIPGIVCERARKNSKDECHQLDAKAVTANAMRPQRGERWNAGKAVVPVTSESHHRTSRGPGE